MGESRPFRFGVNMISIGGRDEWAAKCRRAEQLGYDVILVPDHLGAPAPFPALVRAADVTERARVGTFVLNAGFWNPTLLAREVTTVAQLTGDRLELGLGTGYVKSEFDAAGLPWESGGARVSRLARMVEELDGLLEPTPPLLLGGNGDRMLALAATRADIVAFAGLVLRKGATDGTLDLLSAETMDERVAYFRAAAGARLPAIEVNILDQVVAITDDRRSVADDLRVQQGFDHLSTDQVLDVPTMLIGTVAQIVEHLRAGRERYGFSYVTVLEPSLEAMAPVIEALRGT